MISGRAFDGLNYLSRLNLENNRLKTLGRGLFTALPALSYLNLMRNSLETITLHTIQASSMVILLLNLNLIFFLYSLLQPLMNALVNHTGLLLIKGNLYCPLSL